MKIEDQLHGAPEIVQRVMRYAGKTMRTARNPNITARECIELANWMQSALMTQPASQEQADWSHLKPYGYAPGSYMSRCMFCGQTPVGLDKRATSCRPCAEETYNRLRAQEG